VTAGKITPTRITDPTSKVAEVCRALTRAAGRGATLDELADATGYGARQLAPLVWWLTATGRARAVGIRGATPPGQWPAVIYATARHAALLGPVARERSAR
jgi:hypothetical protein